MNERIQGSKGPTDEELRVAVPKDKGGKELRVGIFVLAGLIGTLAALFLLSDPAAMRGRYTLVTQMPDAGGIRKGDPVLMHGVNIGRIRRFSMNETGLVDIDMEIEGEWRLPDDSRTRLAGAGLLGGQTMEILRGVSTVVAEPMDTIPSAETTGGMLETPEEVGNTANDVLVQVRKVLDDQTVGSIRTSTVELEGLLTQLRGIATVQRDQLATLTSSLNRSARGFEAAAAAGPDVARIVARTDSTAMVLRQTGATLDRAVGSLDVVLQRMAAGEGTLGRLSKDDSLYVSLNRAASEIANVAADLRANPRKYVNLEIF